MQSSKVKKISFDWKELSKNDAFSVFRVSCKVTTAEGLEIEGSAFYQWNKAFMLDFQGQHNAENNALNNAIDRVKQTLSFEITAY